MLGLKFHTFAFALLATMESVQKSTEKLPTPCCDDVISVLTSIRPSAAKKNFLQGPCFYGQRRLCLALCILSSLYGHTFSKIVLANFFQFQNE